MNNDNFANSRPTFVKQIFRGLGCDLLSDIKCIGEGALSVLVLNPKRVTIIWIGEWNVVLKFCTLGQLSEYHLIFAEISSISALWTR